LLAAAAKVYSGSAPEAQRPSRGVCLRRSAGILARRREGLKCAENGHLPDQAGEPLGPIAVVDAKDLRAHAPP
jgi:hypothetical protein